METLIYNIDSRIVNMTGDTVFTYDLNKYSTGKIKNAVEIKVSSIEYPNTSHFINSTKGNNTFTVDGTTITLPDGNYTTDDIVTELNSLLTGEGVTLTIDINTGKITFTFAGTKDFDFSNTTEYKSLGASLGFSEDTYTGTSTFSTENIPDITGENYFFLKINDYGHIENKGKRYLAKVLNITPKYALNFDGQNSYVSKVYKFRQPVDITVLNIELRDYLNNLINLNGLPLSFTLEIKVITNKALKKYHELTNFSGELLELILHDNMLEYYTRENEDKKKEKKMFLNNNVGNDLLHYMHNDSNNDINQMNTKHNKPSDNDYKFKY